MTPVAGLHLVEAHCPSRVERWGVAQLAPVSQLQTPSQVMIRAWGWHDVQNVGDATYATPSISSAFLICGLAAAQIHTA